MSRDRDLIPDGRMLYTGLAFMAIVVSYFMNSGSDRRSINLSISPQVRENPLESLTNYDPRIYSKK